MSELITFEVPGPPRTKKNHGERVRRGTRTLSVPSEAYRVWAWRAKFAVPAIRRAAAEIGLALPITADVNCRATFYRHADVGDAVGFYQGVADWMENVGILKNDVQIRSWDGSRLSKDKARPRVEVTLEAIEQRSSTRKRKVVRK